MMNRRRFTPWSTLGSIVGRAPSWWPEEERDRIQAYDKYDQMYWNDPTQYSLRVLEGEQPIYVPNPRIIVDTTSRYLMKGFHVKPTRANQEARTLLSDFLKREKLNSKVRTNVKAGITRGDFAFHITANPDKPEGSRVSIETLHPGMVYRGYDPDDGETVVRMHIFWQVAPEKEGDLDKVRRVTYSKEVVNGRARIIFEDAVYELEPTWYGPTPKKSKTIQAPTALPEAITEFPIFWFNNIEWESQEYGSSDLRGLEYLAAAVSQSDTDVSTTLALEGLGVYATDGGRPVDDRGNEEDWEVSPGKVMEVTQGSYFRRVEGVGSITPMTDQISYLEKKMFEASSLTDVSMGQVDVGVAQSGIALAIKFMPTLARVEERESHQMATMDQMLYNLRIWYSEYEGRELPELEPELDASKLPVNAKDRLNELNNMFDRNIISRRYYRDEMAKLGHDIPANEDTTILNEGEKFKNLNPAQGGTGAGAGTSGLPPESDPDNGTVDRAENRSNNRSRPNESSGNEA